MTDFAVVDIPSILSRVVQRQTESGGWEPDPNWHKEVTETYRVLAKFYDEHALLKNRLRTVSSTDLKIMWSDLTEYGKAFSREHEERWLQSIDRDGIGYETKARKLEKRWQEFAASRDYNQVKP